VAHGGLTRWVVDRSLFFQRSWRVHYVNTTQTVKLGVTTYAICAPFGP
jgi:hypothetical protein